MLNNSDKNNENRRDHNESHFRGVRREFRNTQGQNTNRGADFDRYQANYGNNQGINNNLQNGNYYASHQQNNSMHQGQGHYEHDYHPQEQYRQPSLRGGFQRQGYAPQAQDHYIHSNERLQPYPPQYPAYGRNAEHKRSRVNSRANSRTSQGRGRGQNNPQNNGRRSFFRGKVPTDEEMNNELLTYFGSN